MASTRFARWTALRAAVNVGTGGWPSSRAVEPSRVLRPSSHEACMRALILGGDGFCGWPTALHLSARGADICIVDNLSRRNIDIELGVQSLTPIGTIAERIAAWREISGK